MFLATIIFALVRAELPSLLVLLVVGWGFMVYFNMSNILVQTHVEDELRGRVMGVYSLTFAGFMPIGALIAGAAADQISAPATVIGGAVITLAIMVLVVFMVPTLRQLE